MHRKLFTAVLAFALLPTMALAQEEEMGGSAFGPEAGDWEITFGGGGATSQDVDVTDANFNGSFGYFFTEAWQLSVRQDLRFSDSGPSNLNGQTRVALDYHFDLDRLRPFVGINGGRVYGDATADSWAAGLEAGAKFYALEKTFFFGRLEYQWFFDNGSEIDDSFEDGNFIYTFGIGFNF